MSRDQLSMEQIDALAAELAAAGRRARSATVRRDRPDPAFAVALRARLVAELPAPAAGRPAGGSGAAPTPRQPERRDRRERPGGALASRQERGFPAGASAGSPEPRIERRYLAARPFTRSWPLESPRAPASSGAPESLPESLPPVSLPPPIAAAPSGASAAGDVASAGLRPTVVAPAGLRPTVVWRLPTRIASARWLAAGVAACLVVASLLYGNGVLWPVRAPATADDAVAATLVRDGVDTPLTRGVALREGDEIRVGTGGGATLGLGSSIARLAPGADVRIDSLDAGRLAVSQLAGRVYHRVGVASGGEYEVRTGAVTWAAHGTAFDLRRMPPVSPSAAGSVVALALEHSIAVDGPGLEATLDQGTQAIVALGPGDSPGSPTIERIPASTLADEWLARNANLDARLHLPLGELAGLVTPEPTAAPSAPANPTGEPSPVATPASTTKTPGGTASPGPTATARPTPKPTPRPTPKPALRPTPVPTPLPTPVPTRTPAPTAKPTATATLPPTGGLGKIIAVDNGDGTYTLSWSPYGGPIDFSYYKLVGEPAGTNPDYTASGHYWAVIDPSQHAWTGGIAPGSWWIRAQAIYYPDGAYAAAQTDILQLTVP